MIDNNLSVTIGMLGGFTLEASGVQVTDNQGRAHQLWNLLEYLVAFRHREVPQEELLDVLWEEGESDNPSNALKNLVYRVRTLLVENGIPQGNKLILRRRGSYCLNPEFHYQVDTEEFERLCGTAAVEGADSEERIRLYNRALQLYGGDFLPKSCHQKWAAPLTAYFHNLYVKAARELCELLGREQRYDEILEVCERATAIDRHDEDLHQQLIRALIRLGRHNRALAHYEYMTGVFYADGHPKGIPTSRPSENWQNLYQEIISTVRYVETDLRAIEADLREPSLLEGAFFCEYEIFKNIYRLQLRIAARSGQPYCLILVTLSPQGVDGQELIAQLGDAMMTLLGVLRSSLRKGDVISRFSASQYLLLLPVARESLAQAVLERVIGRYQREENPVDVTYSITEVAPAE